MAWTANLKGKRQEASGVYLTVEFSDGTRGISKEILVNGSTLNDVKKIIKSEVDKQIKNELLLDSLPLDTKIPSPDAEIIPGPNPIILTQEELDKQQADTNYFKWLQVRGAIDAGILTGTEPDVVALKELVISEYKIEPIIAKNTTAAIIK